MDIVSVDNLVKRYGDLIALDHFNLHIRPGEVFGLLGPNGSGKTTAINCILQLLTFDKGAIRLFGEDMAPTRYDLKRRIGVVLDTCAFPVTMRVRDVGDLGKAAYRCWDPTEFERLCERFGLTPKKPVKGLSRGMGMKLTLAFALAHDPELLVLDEATAGLDPLARDEVLDILRGFMASGDRGILMSTHITSDLEKIADEVVCIDAGHPVFSLPKDVICDEAGVARCRAGELEEVLGSGALAPGAARVLRHDYGVDVLVPDRFAFARAFPQVPVDKASIEDYMTLMLKGEAR